MWTARNQPRISIHLYTPQIYMANGSDTLGATSSSVLLGYAAVDLAKPTRIKSLELKLSGRYRASWAKGVGPSRQTYSVDREFYHQSVALSQQQVVSDAYGTDSCHSFASILASLMGGHMPFATKSSSAPTCLRHGAACHTHQYGETGFGLPRGLHRFAFALALPPTLPSTVVSPIGGIQYTLAARLKPATNLLSSGGASDCHPIHIISLPAKLAHPPFSPEAVFSRQIEDSWRVCAELMTPSVSPGELVQVSIHIQCTAAAATAASNKRESLGTRLELVGVRMTLVEQAVYNPQLAAPHQKRTETPVASASHPEHSDVPSCHPTIPDTKPHPKSSYPLQRDTSADGAKYKVSLRVPQLVHTDKHNTRSAGHRVHISCASAHAAISHSLHVSLRVGDGRSPHQHQVLSFQACVDVVPAPESYALPAYAASALDTLILCGS